MLRCRNTKLSIKNVYKSRKKINEFDLLIMEENIAMHITLLVLLYYLVVLLILYYYSIREHFLV